MIWTGMLLSIPCFFLDLKKYRNSHRVVFMILVLVSIVEGYGKYLGLNGIPNAWVFNLGFVYSETILVMVYFSIVVDNPMAKKFFRIIAGLFILLAFANIGFLQPIDQLHSSSLSIASIIIILSSLYFFFRLLTKDLYFDERLWQVPDFWVISFFLLFYSSSLLYFTFIADIIALGGDLQKLLTFVLKIVSGTLYLVLGLVYYLPLLRQKSSDSFSTDFGSMNS
jgi:hypothetical protein